jgi:hypothetical protein
MAGSTRRQQSVPNSRSRLDTIQQRLRLLQVSHIEALGKPAVGRRQKVMGFRVAALFAA